ncbi:Xaa-Pro peptidase family protein [Lichenihabitans sp. Uapishka_5]|uniref:M24 family metallopeptidase n=1 Tax=Lichenihabitans sp. Uapishka_5 TaxID=3037302 RepID=UPI0029E80493|nr:Xaa-Pro peptidase family protein [Lichenihabitans sp. Uapishka_5]MDX7953173.1 Xaa-Pro peptidase family protein [Lichenihabitans sp. Uapishka_5]
MALHFERADYAARLAALQAGMASANLDGLLLFAQESHYWLTGYDTFGFCFFQCLYVGADGRMALLTRSADLRQAQHTSLIADIRVWTDAAEADPAVDLRRMLDDLGVAGARLGVEYDSYGLTYANGLRLAAALDGSCALQDASRLVPGLRVTKSAAEIAFVREAARLSDAADAAAQAATAPGADEGDILAAQHAAIFGGGGDYPGNEFIIGSGADALLCRYKSGRRRLDPNDQLTLEFAGAYRHYHAAIMRTLVVGEPRPLHLRYHAAARAALAACEAAFRPGRTAGDVYAAHARIFDQHDLGQHRLNACGYSLGAKFTPSWMDPPMFYARNPFVIAENQVFFAHMILMDSETGTAMCLGRTSLVTSTGAEPLNAANLDLVVKSR